MAYWRSEDLDAYFEKYAPSMVGRRPAVLGVNGGHEQNDQHGKFWPLEANLDFEYIMTFTNRAVLYYQIGDLKLISKMAPTLNGFPAAFDATYCEALSNEIDTLPHNTTRTWSTISQTADCGTINKLPSVLSISYARDEANFPASYLRQQCLQFLKRGLQGVSVIVSSGDRGTAGKRTVGFLNPRSLCQSICI
jgi:tripeptidyl-peptidase I